MSNSITLSTTIVKHPIKDKSDKLSQEDKVKIATQRVLQRLRKKYKNSQLIGAFRLVKTIDKKEIASRLKKYDASFGRIVANDNSHISPDGGFIFCNIRGRYKLILSSESKKQGTNASRREQGFPPQAKGNAVERSHKNYLEISHFCISEPVYPYVLFISGCDFGNGSSIIDRLTSLNFYRRYNKVEVIKVNGNSIISLFIRRKEWSSTEMAEILYKTAIKVIRYYLKSLKS